MSSLKDLFLLNREVTFLNHGSFGACPSPVFEAYQHYQRLLEYQPVDFIIKTGPKLVEESKHVLGEYINANPRDLVLIPSPTHAVNIVAKSIDLKEGDEILATNLEYGACDRAWKYYTRQVGASYITAEISLPLTSDELFIEEFFKSCTNKTKLVFISEITSMTALILPVRGIIAEAKKRGIPIFVDGAHSIAHIDLDLRELDVDYYTAACHKWMLTPKGSSFIYVRESLQDKIQPYIVSWGYESPWPTGSTYHDYLQFNGTRDFSAFLTIPDAIKFLDQHNWKQVSIDCKTMVRKWLPKFNDLFQSKPLAPLTDEYFGQMASIHLQANDPLSLKEILIDEYKIEIPVFQQNGNIYLRYSINGYNDENDLQRLFDALVELKEKNLVTDLNN